MSSARPSAAARCHDDHLSPVFCFLNTADFACAIRVCRQWSRIGLLKSAWPSLDLDSLWAGPAHRGMSHAQRSGPRVEFLLRSRYSVEEHMVLANAFINNPLWTKHACHVRLRGSCHRDGDDVELVSPAFLGLPRFTKMQSLVLIDAIPPADHVREVFSALAPRLLAFSLHPDAQSTRDSIHCTHLLTNLRLLSVTAHCTAGLLAPLVHLETLHLGQRIQTSGDESKELIVAIRRLSVQHQLRTFNMVDAEAQDEIGWLTRSLPDGLAAASLTTVSLQGSIDPSLLLLPALARLEFGTFHSICHMLPDRVSSSLRHLRITDKNQRGRWPYRDLGTRMPLVETIDATQAINNVSFDLLLFEQLRELTADCGRDGLALATLQLLSKLEHLTQLTVRIHPLYSLPQLTLIDLKALSRSRSLRRLVCILSVPPADGAHQWDCKPTFAMKLDEAERLLDFEVHVRSHSHSDCAIYALQLLKAVTGARLQWRSMDRRCKEH